MTEPDHDAAMMQHLLDQLEPHGLGADRIIIRYENDLQDYDVLIIGGELTDAQITAVLGATLMGGCPRFTDDRNTQKFHEAEGRASGETLSQLAADARLRDPSLPGLRRPAETLEDFVLSLELWAGAAPGALLTVVDQATVRMTFGGLNYAALSEKITTLIAVLSANDIKLQLEGAVARPKD